MMKKEARSSQRRVNRIHERDESKVSSFSKLFDLI